MRVVAAICLALVLPAAARARADDAPTSPTRESAPAIAALARQAMIQALTGDDAGLRRTAALAERVERAGDAPGLRTSDEIALLEAWALPRGPRRNAFLERIRRAGPSDQVAQRVATALAEDPVRQVRSLRRQDRLNRFAMVFNSLSRVATRAVVGNFQGAAQAFIDTLFLWKPLRSITPRNRLAADVYQRNDEWVQTAGYDAPDVARYAMRIARKRRRDTAEEAIARGRWHLANDRPEMARRAFHRAADIDPDNAAARKWALRAARVTSAIKRSRIAARRVENPLPQDADAQARAVDRLARTMCLPEGAHALGAAGKLVSDHPGSSYVDDAAYCILAVAPTSPTVRAAGLAAIEAHPEGNAARRLEAMRESPWGSPAQRLERASGRYRSDLWGFVFLGDRNDAQSLKEYASQGVAHRIVSSLGFFLPIQWIVRGAMAKWGRPVDDEGWRDAAVDYLESPGAGGDLAERTAERLVKSYERIDRYGDAAEWRRRSGTGTEKALAELREKEAMAMLRRAREAERPQRRVELLQRVERLFPDTPAAQKARKAMEREAAEDTEYLRISREELVAFPDLWRGRGMRLREEWLDGEEANGEMADEGLRFLEPEARRIEFTIEEPEGDQRYIVTPNAESLAELRGPLRAWLRKHRSDQTARRMAQGAGLGWSIQGSAGASGVDVYPALRPRPFDAERLPLYDTIVAPRR